MAESDADLSINMTSLKDNVTKDVGISIVVPKQVKSKSTPLAKLSEQSNGDTKDLKESKSSSTLSSDKASTKEKPASKKGKLRNNVPKFSDKGLCTNCKSDQCISESICCYLCDGRFHACCREKTNAVSSYAICTPTSHKVLMPLIAKYGQANAQRWGQIMFMCNKCEVRVRRLKNLTSKFIHASCQTGVEISSIVDSECQTDAAKLNVTNSECQATDDNSNVNYSTNSKSSLIDDIKPLLCDLKFDILKDVEQLINCKLTESSIKHDVEEDVAPKLLYSTSVSSGIAIENSSENPILHSNKAVNVPKSSMENESKDQIVVLSTTSQSVEVDEITKVIDEKFENIPFNYVKTNNTNKKIILGFPSEKYACSGKQLLESCPTLIDNNYSIADAKKVYPKITVSNIPNYLISHVISEKQRMTTDSYRGQLKDTLLNKILEKNGKIKDFQSGGKVFEIVYVNVGVDNTTLGIKVSPVIRDFLLKAGRIYVGNVMCSVIDRFHLKQCFKCQKIGHISVACKEDHSICMYCSANHTTRNCPNKKNRSSFKCRNCAQSKDPSISSLCDTHNSGSKDCPCIIREINRLRERTDYSKNL